METRKGDEKQIVIAEVVKTFLFAILIFCRILNDSNVQVYAIEDHNIDLFIGGSI